MKLFVGLGNPGKKYARNRHNFGFMAADSIASDYGFTTWRKKFHGSLCEGTLDGIRTLLLKPQTFMNESGRSVRAAAEYFGINPCDIVVFHDEIDLPLTKVRTKIGGGNAGHNGLKSIDRHIGSDYRRVRLGINHPGERDLVHRHVLADFSLQEKDQVERVLNGVSAGALALAAGREDQFLCSIDQIAHEQPGTDRAKVSRQSKTFGTLARFLGLR